MAERDIRNETLKWLEQKWPEPRQCPICRHNTWSVNGPYAGMSLDGTSIIMGNFTPLIHVTCMNCAYTHQFNLIAMGLYGGDAQE